MNGRIWAIVRGKCAMHTYTHTFRVSESGGKWLRNCHEFSKIARRKWKQLYIYSSSIDRPNRNRATIKKKGNRQIKLREKPASLAMIQSFCYFHDACHYYFYDCFFFLSFLHSWRHVLKQQVLWNRIWNGSKHFVFYFLPVVWENMRTHCSYFSPTEIIDINKGARKLKWQK